MNPLCYVFDEFGTGEVAVLKVKCANGQQVIEHISRTTTSIEYSMISTFSRINI